MIEPTKRAEVDAATEKRILDKIMPDVMDLLNQMKTEMGGILPEELSYGMVAGYLHGRGHTWSEAFFGMHRWITVMKKNYADNIGPIEGTMVIKGNKDGTVSVNVEEKKS